MDRLAAHPHALTGGDPALRTAGFAALRVDASDDGVLFPTCDALPVGGDERAEPAAPWDLQRSLDPAAAPDAVASGVTRRPWFDRATEPRASVLGDESRRRAWLLARFLLGAAIFAPLTFAGTLRLPGAGLAPNDVFALLTCLTLPGLWWLARTPRFVLAARLLGALSLLWIPMPVLAGGGPEGVLAASSASVATLIVLGLVLPDRAVAALGLGSLFVLLLTALLHPDFALVGLVEPVLLLAVGMLGVLASVRARAQDRRALEENADALRLSQQRYATAGRGATDGLWDWDLRSGALFLSPRWCELLGVSELNVPPTLHGWFDRVHPEDLPRLRRSLALFLSSSDDTFESSHRLAHARGGFRWFGVRGLAVRDADGHVLRIAGSQSDITERKEFEDQLVHDAFHDPLTGLPNRALFLNRVTLCIARRTRRSDYHFAVLFLDLDRFKVINDSLGHRVGDLLLREVARRLGECLRPGDSVARLGGDEFAILLDELVDVGGAVEVAERIRAAVERPFSLDGQELVVSASIGIAPSTLPYQRPEDLIRDADTAMYRVKARGRAGQAVFNREMHDRAVRRLHLESDLRRGLDNGDFQAHYQPLVDLATGRIVGFEALARWRRDGVLISPVEFIPVAEETGLVERIDSVVLRAACAQLAEWQARIGDGRTLTLNVNVSSRSFRRRDLVASIEAVLAETGCPPRQLHLEITESVVMEDPARSRLMLAELRAFGVRVAIDDFGTGYSSLSYLHQFDLDDLKVDRSFVLGMGAERDTTRIVETVVALGRGLGLAVTAEGVETADHLQRVRELGCERAQGYFFSRPLAAVPAWGLLIDDPRW